MDCLALVRLLRKMEPRLKGDAASAADPWESTEFKRLGLQFLTKPYSTGKSDGGFARTAQAQPN